jgi:hypothetical protein
MTGGWTDWLAPEVLPLLVIQFLPFFFLPPLLIFATCLWPRHREAAKTYFKIALVVLVVGVFWEILIL